MNRLRLAVGEDSVIEFIGLFLGEISGRLQTITEALRRRDAKAITIASHDLKNSCGNFGARKMMALCDIIEQAGRAESLGRLPSDVLTRLERECERVSADLEAERERG